MTNVIAYPAWVQVLKSDYLDSYIKEGGSAIKFAVLMEEGTLTGLSTHLKQAASELGYLTVAVDARQTRVNLLQEVFFKIAEQIDWRFLARQVVEKLLLESGYGIPAQSDDSLLAVIAQENGLDPSLIRSEIGRKLNDQVFRHRGLVKDFRVAMMKLCLAELSGGEDGSYTAGALTDWLTGRNRRLGAVKPYEIYNSISRTNARYMFESLVCWVRFAGHTGLLVLLDITRLTLSRNPHDEDNYYTRASVMDAYELLRKFIDAIDRLPGSLIVVAASTEFLNEDPGARGLGDYQALRFRVADEIRDRNLVNPMATLVRVSDGEPGGGT